MEDKVVACEINLETGNAHSPAGFFAVFDGHGGDQASTMLQQGMPAQIASQTSYFEDPVAALVSAAHEMDWHILSRAAQIIHSKNVAAASGKSKSLLRTSRKAANEDNHLSGSTGAFVVVTKNEATGKVELHVAWTGDSRVVLSTARGGIVRQMSDDHKASLEMEKKRIRAAGGSVDRNDRLYGDLAVSRAFGDIYHKGQIEGRDSHEFIRNIAHEIALDEAHKLQNGALICTPDVVLHTVEPEDEFFIIASDGVWDVLSNEEAVHFIRRQFHKGLGVAGAAKELVRKSLLNGSVDNVSAVVVVLNQEHGGQIDNIAGP